MPEIFQPCPVVFCGGLLSVWGVVWFFDEEEMWRLWLATSAPLHQGRLGLMVGFPSMWLEIYPVRMEFQPLGGNPSSGWKFHQGLVGFPTICPKMAGWKSNHPWAKARPEISRSFMIPQCKVVKWECIWASLNLLNNSLRIFKLWKWKLIAIHPYFNIESESVSFIPI